MLTGQELLDKIKELGAISRSDVARACGYVTTKKDGSERINFTAFYEAISEAKGVILAPPEGKAKGKRGKPLSFCVKSSKGGVIPVTAGYAELIGVGPSQHVMIEHGDGWLKLTKAEDAEAPAAAACEAPAPVVVTETYDAAPAATAEAVTTYDDEPAKEPALAPF